MAIRIVSAGTTLVKRITVGTPTQIGNPSVGTLASLDDVNSSNLADTYILRWDSASQTFLFYDFDSDVKNLINTETPLDYTPSTGLITHLTSGVVAGDYGGSTSIPTISVDQYGHIDSIGEVDVAGVSDFVYDDNTAQLQVETADGNTFPVTLNLNAFTTANLTEDSNYLYYTDERVDDRVSNLIIGGTNISATYNDSDGTLTLSANSVGGYDLSSNNTDDLSEGSTNLYFTEARARSSFSLNVDSDLFSYDSSSGILSVVDSAIARTDRIETFREGITIPDSKKIIFCDNAADIFENSGNFFIRRNNTAESDGNIFISAKDSNSVYINNRTGDRFIAHFHDAGAVDLFYNNTRRISTTNTGGEVLGNLSVSGNTTLLGDLTVQGTTTTINSTTLSVNDKNIVLADSAADSAAANGAGITVDGANASIIYSSVTDTWDLNKPLSSIVNHLQNFNTNNLTEGSSNLYYTSVRQDSDFAVSLATKTTSDLTEGVNLYYTIDRFDSAFSNKSTTDLTEGLNLYYTETRVDSAFDRNFDSATTDKLSEGSLNLYYTTNRFDSDFGDNTTTDLTEGSNLYYTRARFDSALGTDLSISTIRGYFSAAGDLTFNSATGEFSFDVESVYTQANFDSDFNTSLDNAAIGGNGLTYNSSTNTLSIDSSEFTAMFTTDNLNEGSSNLYFTESRVDSAIRDQVETRVIRFVDSNNDLLGRVYDNTLQNKRTVVFETSQDSNAFLFFTNTFGIAAPNGNVLLRTYGDSDKIELYHGGVHRLETEPWGIKYYGSLRGDSAQITGNITANLVTADFDRSANTTVTSGTYGSASQVPVLTVDASGFIDSIGSVSVAGVSSTAFDSDTGYYTISTADGGSFITHVYSDTLVNSSIDTRVTKSFVDALNVDADTFDTLNSTQFLRSDVADNKTAGSLIFNDNVALKIGTGEDLSISHDANDTYITNDTGVLYIQGDTVSITNNAGTGTMGYFTSGDAARLYFNNGEKIRTKSDGVVVTGEVEVSAGITNTTGVINNTPTQSQATSDSVIIVDNTAHDSDFTSIEYTVHMDDSDAGHSQISKVLLTYNKSNVFFTEYGVISSFTNDSDIGTLTADVSGANIRLKFQRATGMGTVNVKPIKTIIK